VRRSLALAGAAIIFAGLATINSAGYRYGVSDQAFYATAVAKAIRPDLFPRDTVLLEAQARLMLADETVGWAARLTGAGLPAIHFVFYLLTLAALFVGARWFARALGLSEWATAVFILLLTFRHQITRTGANTLEGYMHPRQLAFALGVMTFAGVLQGRWLAAAIALIAAAVMHTTTAVWFGIAAGVAVVWSLPNRPRWVGIGAAATVAAGLWAVLAGPLAGRLVRMDAAWLAVLTEKTYLFPASWPAYAWIVNLAYPAIIVAASLRRRASDRDQTGVRHGSDGAQTSRAREGSLVAGLLALVALFLAVTPLTAVPIALAVQLQINRVFWLLDFVALAYVAWWLTGLARSTSGRAALAGVLLALSLGRGAFVLNAANRAVVTVDLPDTRWVEAMRWLERQPATWHVLADPGHGWRYGVSVRLAALHDVLLETGKDTALGIYDRDIAMRIAERIDALHNFERLTTGDVRALAARYALDVVVVEATRSFDLPVLYRNEQFVVYDLR
jgi:hypothetical protein